MNRDILPFFWYDKNMFLRYYFSLHISTIDLLG